MALADVTGAVGAATGALALGISGWAAVISRRAVAEARRLRQQDADRLQLERDARHDDLAPSLPGVIAAELKPDQLGGASLYGTLTFPRDYHIHGRISYGPGRYGPNLSLPLLVRAHQPYTVHIEHWTGSRTRPLTEALELHAWPPIAGPDQANAWTCPCGKPVLAQLPDDPGHWQLRIGVTFEDYQVKDSVA